jgi:hypothetical protein
MNTLRVFDVVAILHDLPEKNIIRGQVGTIIEKLDDNVFEVEFVNKSGETISIETLTGNELFQLHFELENSKA